MRLKNILKMINENLDDQQYICVHLNENDPTSLTQIYLKKSYNAKRMTVRFKTQENRFVLTIPKNCNLRVAHKFINSSKAWLFKQSAKSHEIINVMDGAVIMFKGDELQIKYMNNLRGATRIKTSENNNEFDKLEVFGLEEFLGKKVKDYLKKETKARLNEKVSEYAENLNVKYNKISVKDQSTRWGSCSAKGNLSFSFRLILAPLYVLDYVAAHEVAHLKELNHSKKFWQYVERIYPDYKFAEYWLKHDSQILHKYNFE